MDRMQSLARGGGYDNQGPRGGGGAGDQWSRGESFVSNEILYFLHGHFEATPLDHGGCLSSLIGTRFSSHSFANTLVHDLIYSH